MHGGTSGIMMSGACVLSRCDLSVTVSEIGYNNPYLQCYIVLLSALARAVLGHLNTGIVLLNGICS